jgi:hypothetical protein
LTGAFVGINFCIVKNGSSVTRLWQGLVNNNYSLNGPFSK